jgi:uncharacterized membrane-anchored protein
MAMPGFPQAHRVAAELDAVEPSLADLVARLEPASVEDEPALLREVTHLAAVVERLAATSSFRFAASRACQALVWQRGSELREGRMAGVHTLTGFLARRFGPAMAYCDSVSARLQSAAERTPRASGLLCTRGCERRRPPGERRPRHRHRGDPDRGRGGTRRAPHPRVDPPQAPAGAGQARGLSDGLSPAAA